MFTLQIDGGCKEGLLYEIRGKDTSGRTFVLIFKEMVVRAVVKEGVASRIFKLSPNTITD